MMQEEIVRVHIGSSEDIVVARRLARSIAHGMGFSGGTLTVLATVVSKLARNILVHAGEGEVVLGNRSGPCGTGFSVRATDRGRRTAGVEHCSRDGSSGANPLGLGLGGVSLTMDRFAVHSVAEGPFQGTTVTAIKWLN